MDNRDYYEILGIDQSTESDRIKEAYRKLALKYHPDRNGGNAEAAEKMKAINEAYAVLSNSQKRQEYDAMKHRYGSSAYTHFRHNYSEQDIFTGSDINRIFEELAQSFGLRGFDEIFKEASHNGTRTFQFNSNGVTARGTVFTGTFGKREHATPLRFGRRERKEPLQFPQKGKLGKLAQYAFKKMSGIEFPERGKDIVDIIRLTPQMALKGVPHKYTHWRRDKKIIVKIPPGIRDGQKIRLAGQGEDGKGGTTAGDLFLKVHIKKPILQEISNFLFQFKK